MIAVEDQIMSLKTVQRFFDNAMLNARHYREKCAHAILDGRYSLKQLEFIESVGKEQFVPPFPRMLELIPARLSVGGC